MKKIALIIQICFILISTLVFSQIDKPSNLYTHNLFLITPSAIGTQGETYMYANYRSQFSNMQGSPSGYAAGIYTMLSPVGGAGLYLNNSSAGIYNTNSVSFAYAHKIKLHETMALRFGLNFGGVFRGIDQSKVSTVNPNDPSITSNINENRPRFMVGLSALFHVKQWMFGLAMPTLYNGVLDRNSFFSDYQALAGYKIKLSNPDYEILPLVLFRKYNNGNPMIDANMTAVYKNMFNLRLGFRTFSSSFAYIAGFGFELAKVEFNYAFEWNQGVISTLSPLTHEFGIAFRLGNDAHSYRHSPLHAPHQPSQHKPTEHHNSNHNSK